MLCSIFVLCDKIAKLLNTWAPICFKYSFGDNEHGRRVLLVT